MHLSKANAALSPQRVEMGQDGPLQQTAGTRFRDAAGGEFGVAATSPRPVAPCRVLK